MLLPQLFKITVGHILIILQGSMISPYRVFLGNSIMDLLISPYRRYYKSSKLPLLTMYNAGGWDGIRNIFTENLQCFSCSKSSEIFSEVIKIILGMETYIAYCVKKVQPQKTDWGFQIFGAFYIIKACSECSPRPTL